MAYKFTSRELAVIAGLRKSRPESAFQAQAWARTVRSVAEALAIANGFPADEFVAACDPEADLNEEKLRSLDERMTDLYYELKRTKPHMTPSVAMERIVQRMHLVEDRDAIKKEQHTFHGIYAPNWADDEKLAVILRGYAGQQSTDRNRALLRHAADRLEALNND